MNFLIVYAHPEPTSFREVEVSELRAKNWNAVEKPAGIDSLHIDTSRFSLAHERTVATENRNIAVEINAEQAELSHADMVIFHSPVWLFGMPARLKGWADRVLARGFAYLQGEKYDTGRINEKLTMVAATTGTSANTYPRDGIYGDILSVLWSDHNCMRRSSGFDVLPPYGAYMSGREDDAIRARQLAAFKKRLESIDQTLRLFFHPAEDIGPNERLEPSALARSGQQRDV